MTSDSTTSTTATITRLTTSVQKDAKETKKILLSRPVPSPPVPSRLRSAKYKFGILFHCSVFPHPRFPSRKKGKKGKKGREGREGLR